MPSAHAEKQKEDKKNTTATSFDTVLVFGEGPVKPVLFPSELTSDQRNYWEKYKKDPLTSKEPSFWVADEDFHMMQLFAIEQDERLSIEEKLLKKEQKRFDLQHNGQFCQKRFGKENALAAGLALYTGLTKRVILSGGKTIPAWYKKKLSEDGYMQWPSEAELMKDVIVKAYAKLYLEKYRKRIEDAIILEDKATNTLENFAYTLNKNPKLLDNTYHIGLLTAKHHVKRVCLLAELFAVHIEKALSAASLLQQVSVQAKGADITKTSYLEELEQREKRWRTGLEHPQYVTYWCGYVAEVKYPSVVQTIVKKLQDPTWYHCFKQALAPFGIDVSEYKNADMAYLYDHQPDKYYTFVNTLKQCKSPEYRKMPPPLVQ